MKTMLAIAALVLSTVAANAECHDVCTYRGNTVTCRQVCTGWPGTGPNDYRNNESFVGHVQQAACVQTCMPPPSPGYGQVCTTKCF